MSLDLILIGCAMGLYGVAAVLAVVRLVRIDTKGEGVVVMAAVLGAAFLAAVLIAQGIRAGRIPVFGRFESIACYALAVTVVFLANASHHRMSGVGGILLPYVAVLLLLALPGLRATVPAGVPVHSVWLNLHVVTAFAGYGLFTLSSLLAVAYLIQDRNLKRKNFGGTFERLPSLEKLEHLMHRQAGIGFLMLTAAIVFAVRLVDLSGGGREWLSDPKVAATVATWSVYALLLHLRGNVGRHGRKLAIATLFGLLFILFTFVGVNFLTESRHSFGWPNIPGN